MFMEVVMGDVWKIIVVEVVGGGMFWGEVIGVLV